jgi:hypothetical protein
LISRVAILAAMAAASVSSIVTVQLRQETVAAFEGYVTQAEAQIQREESSRDSFLFMPPASISGIADRERHLRRGDVLVETRGATPEEVPGGLIHHWLGTTFIPNTTIAQVLGVLQDYDHLTRYYRPDVLTSHLISRNADLFVISMRVSEQHVVRVVLDTEYRVHYGRLDLAHQFSFARSTRVTEIDGVGEGNEHPLLEGYDHGFLWRLNTYWRFVQMGDGVFVQCEAVSLTRDVPTGLGWLIGPFIENIPRESLQFTLSATRRAVLAHNGQEGR